MTSTIKAIDKYKNLFIAFLLLNLLDGILTILIFNRGGHELNPMGRFLLNDMAQFWTIKLFGGLLFVGIGAWLITQSEKLKLVSFCGLFGMLIVCIWNMAQMAII